ncbi:amino acid oxidase [Actinorhabdospora filicis]|uniref:D-amino-acid oxidase n=1 Tax=Actinorhabdospora filicis TaxID=1785913 RepID=A0A9W6SEN2_9ACTN|nr:FAD-dependent oxidoreductase [Actinorhabdospora filicis]GLZ75809.1 amino acid oxidase [Actinorhabdospora filicis]
MVFSEGTGTPLEGTGGPTGDRGADAVIIGAGVSGLTTGVTLAESGLAVRILAERMPSRTTSAQAGASWGPYDMVLDERVLRWSRETYEVFAEISRNTLSGVRMVYGTEAFYEHVAEPPSWAVEVPDYRRGLPSGLPAHYVDGWRYTIPIVEMTAYLNHLSDRFVAAGGAIEIRGPLESFREVPKTAAVVNCTGLESRWLVPDAAMRPTRGQLVVVDNPGIDTFFQDNPLGDDLTYILPHGDIVILGGHAGDAEAGMRPDPAIAKAILKRCRTVDPRLEEATVIGHRVGVRPGRPEARVERDARKDMLLIHNYGHGGSGVTLSWGCAREVATLLDG